MAQNNPQGDLAAQLTLLATQLATLQGEVTTLRQANVTLTTANTNLSTQVAGIANAPTAAAGAVGGAPGAPTIRATFATTPAMLRHEDILDYSSKTATMIYEDGCESLTTPFDMKSNGTVIYITELQAKCNRMGWHSGTQQITKFPNDSGIMINIVSEYGQITMSKLQHECETFCLSTGARYTERASQNNQMMTECIMKTLSASARARLLPFRNEIEYNNVVYAPLLHKKVMALATIDSVATTKTLRSNLREITTYCATVKGDIELLHSYFDTNYSQIIARGATVDDPVDILFTAYSVVPCALFRLYIKNKADQYTDGTATFTHEELILLATNKYNLLVQTGEWGAKSLEEEKIVAMQAELTALKGQFALGPKLKAAAGGNDEGSKTRWKKDDEKKGDQGGKKKNKKNTANKRKQKENEKWQRVPPKDGEPLEKKVKDRTFYWCKHHMCWGGHKEKECKKGMERTAQQNDGRSTYAASAASATVGNSDWNNLLANMHRNMADE